MKVAVTADIHLGHSDHLGSLNPQTGLHTRLEDFLRNLDAIVDYVLDPQNDIDLLIIAGDIYKTRNPTNTQQAQLAKRLCRLSEAGQDVLITTGNHDIIVSEGQSHSVGVIKELNLPHISVIDAPSVVEYDGVKFGVMPYIYKQKLGVKTHQEALDYYTQEVERLKSEGATILIGHQSIVGATIPAGKMEKMDPESCYEIVLPQSIFQGFELAIYGHIHEYQVVRSDPLVIYTGPIERIDFSQAGKPVGFVVYDTETKESKFGELPAADLYQVKLDLTDFVADGTEDLTQRVLDVIDMNRLPNAIIRLTCKIRETHLALFDKGRIKNVLDQAKFCAGIKLDIEKERASRNEEVNETIEPAAALRKYIEGHEDLKDIADLLMEKGMEIIHLCDINKE